MFIYTLHCQPTRCALEYRHGPQSFKWIIIHLIILETTQTVCIIYLASGILTLFYLAKHTHTFYQQFSYLNVNLKAPIFIQLLNMHFPHGSGSIWFDEM